MVVESVETPRVDATDPLPRTRRPCVVFCTDDTVEPYNVEEK